MQVSVNVNNINFIDNTVVMITVTVPLEGKLPVTLRFRRDAIRVA